MALKTILVTGISGGIGEACAAHFLALGHTVIGIGRNNNDKLIQAGKNFHFFSCDLLDLEKLSTIANEVSRQFEIDLFLHNAMYTPRHKVFLRYSAEELVRANKVSNIAPVIIIQKISASMRKNNFGRILFLGSAVTITGSKGQLAYLTAKSALEGLTKGLALELAKSSNVTVNLLQLGPVKTEKFTNNVSRENRQKIIDSIPGGELISPDDVAKCLEFFLKDESGIINGSSIPITNSSHLAGFKN